MAGEHIIQNNTFLTLASGITASDVTLAFSTGHGLRLNTVAAPSFIYATLVRAATGELERVKITAHTASADSCTVVRAQDGNTGLTFVAGDKLELRAGKSDWQQALRLGLAENAVTAGGTADAITATLDNTGLHGGTIPDNFQVTVSGCSPNTITTPTLNLTLVAATGAKTIVSGNQTALVAGDIPTIAKFIYRLAWDKWVLLNPLQAILASGANYPRSYAPNPFFQVDQLVLSATATADDVYAHDHWYVLTQTASVQASSQVVQENGQPTNARLTQNQAAAQRFGYACIIESKEAIKLRGQVMTLRPRVRISNSQAVRCAVIEWTGAADLSVVSDIVNDWTSSDYSDGAAKFFVDANYNPLGTGAKTPSAATWTDMDALNVKVGNSCNNLVLFIWTEGTAAQNVTLDIGKVRFVPGTYSGDILIPRFFEEHLYAQRFYFKTFPYHIAPAQGGSQPGAITGMAAKAGAGTGQIMRERLPTSMLRTTGAPVSTTYNPNNANAQVRDTSAGSDCSATTLERVGPNDLTLTFTGNAATAVGNQLFVHVTLEDRL